MCSDMIMPRCKLISLRSIANERIMPQYKTISKMTKLCCMLSQVSVSWSNHLKHLPTMMRRLCSYKHVQSKHPVISHTPMWKESNHLQGIAMPQKPSSTEKYAPMQSTPDEIYQSCLMLQCEKWRLIFSEGWPCLKNPSSTERSMPWHNGHLKNQPSTKKCVPQCDVSNRMAAYPIKKTLWGGYAPV